MTHLPYQLTQAIKLPGPKGTSTPIPYPTEFKYFKFASGANATLGGIVTQAVYFIFAFAGIGLLLMLVMAGFSYLTSAGDSKKLEQGKQRLTNALLGFIIIFGAFWIVQIFGTIFGIQSIIGTSGIFK